MTEPRLTYSEHNIRKESPMTTSLQELMKKAGEENREAESKDRPNAESVQHMAEFLKKWSKGKPIVRQTADSTFWAAGKWMTKLTYPMVEAIVKAGHGELQGDVKRAGARLIMHGAPAIGRVHRRKGRTL